MIGLKIPKMRVYMGKCLFNSGWTSPGEIMEVGPQQAGSKLLLPQFWRDLMNR